jgi:tripartite-type tricarboxylate transporter receptor subunit TctC
MHRTARKLLKAVFAAAAAILCAQALAQSFPNRPIRLVVPFPPGGGTDVVARAVAPRMSEFLGQPIVIDNRGGAGGNVGTEVVAKSAADGYTLLLTSSATAINTTLAKNLSWSLAKDFDPVVLLVMNQSLLVVHPSVPASNVREFLALAKAQPGAVTIASSGNGSSAHLGAELFKLMGGVNLLHVPYKGAAPAMSDLLGGQTNSMLVDIAVAMPHVKAGRVKVLGIGSPRRFDGLPDVPTISESGVPGFEVSGLIGLTAPAGTPREAIERLNAAANRSLEAPEVRERLVGLATIPMGGPPERLGEVIRADIEKWARVIRTAKLSAD